ncbi:acetyltransferase (GNAT) family protein [Plasticicumulans lactativorans]|uniref:Acetyltransferase (GNAT) family protein n=1 Tax=Plasticicumulans lactativorans TaxID=1133106 RepID=A0A4R2LJI6_9GAMM|nr:GNAT family N-acetyltransferase [Plasticicumulans lactativorans]TCO83386.1 acetyltransferase (GNAT) family protein [Plasticicumulans lactativorans]
MPTPSADRVTVQQAATDEEIVATRAVMRQLRPDVPADEYLGTVRRMMQSDGYRLAAVYDGGEVRAVAGYRVMEMLYCGRILYVDDLNTDAAARSQGYGKVLLDWLKAEARAQGCRQLHLDSGVQREQTHRFYFREGLAINCYHFRIPLAPAEG